MPKFEPKLQVEQIQPKVIIKEVIVQSMIDSRLEYRGLETGRLYYWNKAGDTVSVDELDAPDLLKRRLGKKQCCGDSGNYIFQLVGGNNA